MNNKRLLILLDDIEFYKKEIKYNKELDWYIRVENFCDMLLAYEEIKRESTEEFWGKFYNYKDSPMVLWVSSPTKPIYFPFIL